MQPSRWSYSSGKLPENIILKENDLMPPSPSEVTGSILENNDSEYHYEIIKTIYNSKADPDIIKKIEDYEVPGKNFMVIYNIIKKDSLYIDFLEQKSKNKMLKSSINLENKKIFNAMIDSGANVNSVDNTLSTPIVWCVKNNNLDFIKILISQGADIYVSNAKNPAIEAYDKGHAAIFKYLINLDLIGFLKNAEKSKVDFVKMLKTYKFDINPVDHFDLDMSLRFSAYIGNKDLFNLLLDRGANSNCQDVNNGPTTWHILAYQGNIDLMKELINKGITRKIEPTRDLYNNEPFTAAYGNNNIEMCKFLIKNNLVSNEIKNLFINIFKYFNGSLNEINVQENVAPKSFLEILADYTDENNRVAIEDAPDMIREINELLKPTGEFLGGEGVDFICNI